MSDHRDDPRIAPPGAVALLDSELDAQPALLRTLADRWEAPDPALRELVVRPGRRLALVGLGSSRDAALAGQWLLRARGVDATVHMPSEGLEPLGPDALVIALSASGSTATLVEAIERLARRCPVVVVTRDPGSPLAALDDVVVPLWCERERSGIAVWSFLAMLASLIAMTELMTGGSSDPSRETAPASFRGAADLLSQVRASGAASIDELAARLTAASIVHLVAPLSRLGPALQAAQVLREVPRLPAVALAAEDWDHAHAYLTVDPGYVAMVSGPTEADAELRRWILGRERGLLALGRPIADGGTGVVFDADARVRTLVECPLVESVAVRAWALGN
jgi:fructoselysine-6-P-deglycase FrlB-like protein